MARSKKESSKKRPTLDEWEQRSVQQSLRDVQRDAAEHAALEEDSRTKSPRQSSS